MRGQLLALRGVMSRTGDPQHEHTCPSCDTCAKNMKRSSYVNDCKNGLVVVATGEEVAGSLSAEHQRRNSIHVVFR